MELTIKHLLGGWLVTNAKGVFGAPYISIGCDSAEEAMEILHQLNGKPYEVINAFYQTRKRLTRP